MSRKHESIQWTKELAASEFDINPRTLTDRLRQDGINPDENGFFTTKQICAAVYGDIRGELIRAQTRNQNEAADMTAIRKSNLLRENIPAELVERVWSSTLIELRQRISYAEIPDKVKQELSRDLMACPTADYFKNSKPADEDESSAAN